MSTSTLSIASTRPAWLMRAADYVELTKPRIATLVLISVGVAAWLASNGAPNLWILAGALLGTALVAASASAVNQLLERETDARMPRTASRPLPAGRLSIGEVWAFALITVVAGLLCLALMAGPLPMLLGLSTWILYSWIYTPLKTRTPSNTPVGAVAGALPILIGWTAMGAPIDLRAWALFLVLYLWQFPHFMAIAWLYRHQYGAAGVKMLSVVDASGHRTGALAIVAGLCLIPVSVLPSLAQPAGELYSIWAILLGSAQLVTAVWFFVDRSDRSARRLLMASLLYLPALLGVLVLGPLA